MRRLGTFLVAVSLGTAIILEVQILAVSRFLRPLDDDYCIASRARLGLIGGFLEDWNTYSGFITPSFLANALVGVPGARFPLFAVSSVAFWGATLGLLTLVLLPLVQFVFISEGRRKGLVAIALATVTLLPSWWAYFWSEFSPSGRSSPSLIALGITHWQTLNAAYVLPVSILIAGIGTVLLWRDSSRRSGIRLLMALIVGLLSGLMGPTFAIAVLMFLITLAGAMWLIPGQVASARLRSGVVLLIATLLGLALALAAPGTRARARLGQDAVPSDELAGWIGPYSGRFPLDLDSIRSVFATLVPNTLAQTVDQIWRPGTFVVLGISLGIGYWLRTNGHLLRPQPLALLTLTLIWAAIIANAATFLTDTFTGFGTYYHHLYGYIIIYISIITSGLAAGISLNMHNRLVTKALVLLVTIAALSLQFAAVQGLWDSITNRYLAWESGSAPISEVGFDREIRSLEECWRATRSEK